ncbi:hypothetical protein SMSP1_01827 [Sedimentisphaera salicampi]|nr:hypothetical protein SMSP1_01827 [Sedimentisphaera salicampi]
MQEKIYSFFDSASNSLNPEEFWALTATEAIIPLIVYMTIGVLYLCWGWRFFKVITAVTFTVTGLFLGFKLGEFLGSPVLTGIIFSIIFLFFSFPVLRFAVSLLSCIIFSALSCMFWIDQAMPEKYIIAVFFAGLILGGLLGYYLFRAAIILITSSAGAYFLIAGIWGVLRMSSDYTGINAEELFDQISGSGVYILMFVLPALGGVLMQMREFPLREKKKEKEKEES